MYIHNTCTCTCYFLYSLNLPVLTHTHTSRSLTPNKTPVPTREYSGRLAETQRQEIEESSGEDDSFYLTKNQTLQLWDQVQQVINVWMCATCTLYMHVHVYTCIHVFLLVPL